MSETETVNILPGPHGERLWVSLEELESSEPLLEGHKPNTRRAGVIQRARDELAERGCGENPEYARALELLDMLTPTSSHATWCKLRDELVRLKDNAAHLVSPECDLVLMDILASIKSDVDLLPKLHDKCLAFVESHRSGLHDFEHGLEGMMRRIGDGAKGGEAIRRYMVDMARFGSGVDDGLILRVVRGTYIEQGLYREACAVCEDIVGFEGDDRIRMLGSTLVEDVIDGLLARLSRSREPGRHETLVQTCVDILKRRAGSLGISQDPGEGTALRQASRLANSIRARRRLKTAGEIDAWIRDRYPLSYGFLNLGHGKIMGMLKGNAHLVENVSVRMACDGLEDARHMPRSAGGVLEEIEDLVRRMREGGIRTDQAFKDWKDAMREKSLWSTLPEIRIYLRLTLAGQDVEVHAPVEGGSNVDLRVGDCYMEVLSPDDGTLLLSRQSIDDEALAERALKKAMGKRQLDSVGDRTAMLVMDCSHILFSNPRLRERLASVISERPQLAGVLLILFDNDRYLTHFVENPAASAPVPRETVGMVSAALEKRP